MFGGFNRGGKRLLTIVAAGGEAQAGTHRECKEWDHCDTHTGVTLRDDLLVPQSLRSVRSGWIPVVAAGVILGLVAAASDVLAHGQSSDDRWRALSAVLNAGVVWAAVAFWSGRRFPTPTPAAIAGLVTLAGAVIAYYLYGSAVGNRTHIRVDSLVEAAVTWLGRGIVAGPLLGIMGWCSRRAGLPGVMAALVIPAGAFAEIVVLGSLGGRAFGADPWWAWSQVGVLLWAVGMGVWLITGREVGRPARS